MIDRIVIENFKSLRRVDLKLGRLNLLVGANGSGKLNLLDALRGECSAHAGTASVDDGRRHHRLVAGDAWSDGLVLGRPDAHAARSSP